MLAGLTLLSAKELEVYKLNNNNLINVAKINYSDNILIRNISIEEKNKNKLINILSNDLETYIYNDKNKLILNYKEQEKNRNTCISFDHHENMYKFEQIFTKAGIKYEISKKYKDSKSWELLAASNNNRITLTQKGDIRKEIVDYSNPHTIIVKEKIDGTIQKILIEKNGKSMYLGCGNLDDSFILNETVKNDNFNLKYYEVKNGTLKYLGKLDPQMYPESIYDYYKGEPKLLLFKGKKVFHFNKEKLELLKDFTSIQGIDRVTYDNSIFYGFKL
jgi:hypothetical protein